MNKHHWHYFSALACVPILAAGLFVLVVSIQAQFRYDPDYFTPRYQNLYSSSRTTIEALEKAIQTGDSMLYAELIGLRKKPSAVKHNPDIRFAMLMEVDEAGYFHYLFSDAKTYERSSFYLKKLPGRWVVVPQDADFFLDSGKWLVVFTPLALIWWSLLIVVELATFIHRYAARLRENLFKGML